jgi:hypothetical protein
LKIIKNWKLGLGTDAIYHNSSSETALAGIFRILVVISINRFSCCWYVSSPLSPKALTDLPKQEDMMPERKSPYAVSKLAYEHYAQVFKELYSLEISTKR